MQDSLAPAGTWVSLNLLSKYYCHSNAGNLVSLAASRADWKHRPSQDRSINRRAFFHRERERGSMRIGKSVRCMSLAAFAKQPKKNDPSTIDKMARVRCNYRRDRRQAEKYIDGTRCTDSALLKFYLATLVQRRGSITQTPCRDIPCMQVERCRATRSRPCDLHEGLVLCGDRVFYK